MDVYSVTNIAKAMQISFVYEFASLLYILFVIFLMYFIYFFLILQNTVQAFMKIITPNV